MKYVNLTPHDIHFNDGRIFVKDADVLAARVGTVFGDIVDDIAIQSAGPVENLPAPVDGTRYIVSAMVLGACSNRPDVVAPATGHPACVRNDKGHIVSVPCFTRLKSLA